MISGSGHFSITDFHWKKNNENPDDVTFVAVCTNQKAFLTSGEQDLSARAALQPYSMSWWCCFVTHFTFIKNLSFLEFGHCTWPYYKPKNDQNTIWRKRSKSSHLWHWKHEMLLQQLSNYSYWLIFCQLILSALLTCFKVCLQYYFIYLYKHTFTDTPHTTIYYIITTFHMYTYSFEMWTVLWCREVSRKYKWKEKKSASISNM